MANQLLLALGGVMLLALISLNLSRRVVDMEEVSYDNEAILTATSLAQSVIQQVATRQFDELAIGKNVTSPDSLTAPASLGPEIGEAPASFDDLDDFNNFSTTIASGRLGNFAVHVSVWYTTLALQGAAAPTACFLKTVTVTVSGNPALKEDVTVSSVVAY